MNGTGERKRSWMAPLLPTVLLMAQCDAFRNERPHPRTHGADISQARLISLDARSCILLHFFPQHVCVYVCVNAEINVLRLLFSMYLSLTFFFLCTSLPCCTSVSLSFVNSVSSLHTHTSSCCSVKILTEMCFISLLISLSLILDNIFINN